MLAKKSKSIQTSRYIVIIFNVFLFILFYIFLIFYFVKYFALLLFVFEFIDQKNFSINQYINIFNFRFSSVIKYSSISEISPKVSNTSSLTLLIALSVIIRPITFLSKYLSMASSIVKVHEGGYKHLDIILELSTILSKNILTMYS